MNEKQQPFVSCIMPTYNRRQFVPHAIRYFLRQDYENKELIIIDDGTDKVSDLVPDIDFIRYFRIDKKITLGAKLNLACEYARGTIIANWDDDDWYAERRLTYQVSVLQNGQTELCGINILLYYDLEAKIAYQYIYPKDQRAWLLGSSLCYRKELWNRIRFSDINVGMDGLFVWATPSDRVTVLPDSTIAVHMIHDKNVSPKKTEGVWWFPYPVDDIKKLMNSDWSFYNDGNFTTSKKNIDTYSIQKSPTTDPCKQLKNVYACLVHDNEDCIIDLVRNLHFHDAGSTILIYNGGNNPSLIQNHFPYKTFGAVMHPKPVPIKHGYLHPFALDCMQFALENFSFDYFTIVDSDQLAIRSGYVGHLSNFFSTQSNIGMLSSAPEAVKNNNTINRVAMQVYKEYDLWKPLLNNFSHDQNNFVHWSFWPSTVFTYNAVRDLNDLFLNNRTLQDLMKHTKIWATEEVVLPTLVKLLGYDIAANPCSYDFVTYQKSYTIENIRYALSKTDAYWIHPIERRYDNPLRKYIRQRFDNYLSTEKQYIVKDTSSEELSFTSSLLSKVKKIEGWLSDKEAELLIYITKKVCKDLPSPHSIVEIGSYHGKSSVLFGSVIKKFFADTKVYAIDTHDGKLGAADQGFKSFPPSFDFFKKNIEKEELVEVTEIIKKNSYDVEWRIPVTLLFIDGLHDYLNVSRDFGHFSNWIKPGGYIAFHDYAAYFPGVKAFVDELLQQGRYLKTHNADSLIVLQKL